MPKARSLYIEWHLIVLLTLLIVPAWTCAAQAGPSTGKISQGGGSNSDTKTQKKDTPMSQHDSSSSLPEIRTLWDFNDPKKSEAKFRELLPKAAEMGDSSYRLQLLTQVARAQGLQRRFDDAHKTLDDVKGSLPSAPPIVHVRYLLERGRVFNSSQKPAESKTLFVEAWEVAQKAKLDNLAVDAAHMLGIVEAPEEALRWNEKAMQLAESSSDASCKNWLGPLYNNIGWTYHDKGDFQKALVVFQKALVWREQKKELEPILIARYSVARALRSLKKVDEALAMQQAILKEHEKAGTSDGFVYEEIAECHLLKGHADEAQKYFALAYESLSKDEWLKSSEPDRLERLKKLGKLEGKSE